MAEYLHYYILFQNHTDATAMYRSLKGKGMYAQISPTPRELSVCCGVSLLVHGEDVDRIKEILTSNLSKDISIKEIAEITGISQFYMMHMFKKATGSSINKYKTALKIIQAKKLLINTSKSITDIATECGFNSISYFSDRFIKSEGVTPSEYRKLLKV